MVILSLKLVLRAGLEPTTLCLEGRCNQAQKEPKKAVFRAFLGLFCFAIIKKRGILSWFITNNDKEARDHDLSDETRWNLVL